MTISALFSPQDPQVKITVLPIHTRGAYLFLTSSLIMSLIRSFLLQGYSESPETGFPAASATHVKTFVLNSRLSQWTSMSGSTPWEGLAMQSKCSGNHLPRKTWNTNARSTRAGTFPPADADPQGNHPTGEHICPAWTNELGRWVGLMGLHIKLWKILPAKIFFRYQCTN